MRIVCKFGGTSVANATQIKRIKEIIYDNSNRDIVVVSAPGKTSEKESKVTDLLFLLHAHIEYKVDYEIIIEQIYDRFKTIVTELELSDNFDNEFNKFKGNLKKYSKDELVSRGEYFSALIISEYLGFTFVDAMEAIEVQYDGKVDYDKTKKNLEKYNGNKLVIPGFYSSTPNKQVRLFNRGGSDLTGSILARVIDADLYENWTDVSGIYVADPRIIDNPERIELITYNELRELTYRGARVLQQEAVIPLDKSGIPIQIKNTNRPGDYGTLISNDVNDSGNIITGISGTKNFTALNITKSSDHTLTEVLQDVFNLFSKYKVQVEHLPTGIDTFSIITDTSELKKVYFDFMHELRDINGVIEVEEENEIALLAIVGRNMSRTPGISGRIFNRLGKEKINIKVIAQASKEICIIIGVDNKSYKQAIKALYNEFY